MKVDYLALLQGEFSVESVPLLDFHAHTSWTDGTHSVQEIYAQAMKIGLQCILFSEHVRKTSEEWFYRFAGEVRSVSNEACVALVGVETRIADFEGNIDCVSEVLTECDMVLASVHRFPDGKGGMVPFEEVELSKAEEWEFRLASAVLDNPAVTILAHPFGMCYRRYGIAPSEEHIRALIAKAATRDVAFEINAYYHPEPWKLIEWCRQAGTRISLGSDAHHRVEVGNITRRLKGENAIWNRSGSL